MKKLLVLSIVFAMVSSAIADLTISVHEVGGAPYDGHPLQPGEELWLDIDADNLTSAEYYYWALVCDQSLGTISGGVAITAPSPPAGDGNHVCNGWFCGFDFGYYWGPALLSGEWGREGLIADADSDTLNGTQIDEILFHCEGIEDVTIRLLTTPNFSPGSFSVADTTIIQVYEEPAPATIYVDIDAGGNNDGSSWTHAFTDLQSALAAAVSEDEIRVADGIYKPSVPADPCDVRTKTFQLKNGVAIYGGYAGSGAPNPDDRDPNRYATVLCGDLAGNDGPPPEPPGLLDDPNRAENSYHVVTASGTDANAVLDGFTVTAGNANDFPDHLIGAGMYNNNASPTVTNCIFRSNSAYGGGGAMYNATGSSPAVSNCTFRSNQANIGGGVVNGNLSGPTVTNCRFIGNWVLIDGGGMHNTADSSAAVTNCTFSGNQAGNQGGGVFNFVNSSTTVTNCILWADTPEEINASAPATVRYCDIQGGWSGLGNIDANPNFGDPADGDYHLKSQAGRWDPNTGSWVTDTITSPCIDAGNPGCHLGGEPVDPDNVRINMGAYGGTDEASKTPAGWALLADLTNDGIVDSKDFAHQAMDWQQTESCQPGDLNRDGTVNLADVVLLASDLLEKTTWH